MELYYPFGQSMKGLDYVQTPAKESKFTFNGKEKQTELGLNHYDYGARGFDYQLYRTTTLDPHADKYPSVSGYSFLNNNPLRFIDPTGKDVTLYGQDAQDAFRQLQFMNAYNKKQREASTTFDYIFNQNGQFIEKKQNERKEHSLIIQNTIAKTQERHSFHDPSNDPSIIDYNINKFGEEKFKDIPFIFWIADVPIEDMMKGAKVEVNKNKSERRSMLNVGWQSKGGGDLDFAATELVSFVRNIWGETFGAESWTSDEWLGDKGPFFLIGRDKEAYNTLDAGNWLWGNAMNRLGYDLSEAQGGARTFNPWDTQADQKAIQAGWFYYKIFQKVKK